MRTAIATALLLAALLGEQRALTAAEPKKRPDSTCRSAGVLKFDGESQPMQRVRASHASSCLLVGRLQNERTYGGRAEAWRSAASTDTTRAATTRTRTRSDCKYCTGLLVLVGE